MPLQDGLADTPIAFRLATALTEMGSRAAVLDSAAADQDAEWFNTFEQAHDVVFYRGDAPDSAWTHLCLRQADRIFLLASADRPLPPRPLDLPVTGDPGALGHALMNLCVNAVDAMEPGGLLTVRTRNDGTSRVLLEVLDTGSGMPAEVLAKAMDPFFTTKPLGKGTGLGLSIVYGTVKAHGGTISIQSEPGRGSRVAIHLPASSSREAEIGEAAQLPFSPSGEALLLLLVDDDELVQETLVAMLETLGHEVRVTSSGKAACAELECGLRPDAIVLDMNMPGLDGAATLPLLRSLLPGVPILLSTGRSNQAVLDLVNNTLDVFLLPKPFDLRVLQEHLMILPKVPKPAVP